MSGSFLTDKDLTDAALSGTPFVDPFDAEAVKSASIDLRLGDQRYEYMFDEHTIGQPIPDDAIKHSNFSEMWLEPNRSAYIGLKEEISIPRDMLGFVFPRSSLTRLGIAIFPVYMNPGYKGIMPITITNNGHARVRIIPGARVAQLLCAKLSGPVMTGYGEQTTAKYYQERVAASKHDEGDFERVMKRVLERRLPNILEQ